MRHPSNMASKSVPFPRVDRQPVLYLHRRHAPGEPTLVVLRLPFGRVLGDLVVALQAPGRQPQLIVRRGKALCPSGCESRPATVAPAGSSRSGAGR